MPQGRKRHPYAGSAVKASHPASFQRSDYTFTKSSWGFDWKKTNQPRSYRKGIQYGLFELTCVRGCVKCSGTWWPIGETGGPGQNLLQSSPNWTKCDTGPAGRWWRDSSKGISYENSAAVDFRSTLGFSLSIKRSYSKNQNRPRRAALGLSLSAAFLSALIARS